VVLEPHYGVVAYIPDLGRDVVRELYYDREKGELAPLHVQACGPPENGPHGPRYIEFHRQLPIAYVINELSSYVAVFHLDMKALAAIAVDGPGAARKPTLRYVQSISTVPAAWPRKDNTCGRICCDPSGNFVLVSNRGHDSIAVLRVEKESVLPGLLTSVGIFHTRGMTPRHFQFDPSGQWLLACNQDNDRVGVFQFNVQSGTLVWTGNYHNINSPNFVMVTNPHERVVCEGLADDFEAFMSEKDARREKGMFSPVARPGRTASFA
jgi:6-phosphogluconolactonase (cycloisomerase 2 family)